MQSGLGRPREVVDVLTVIPVRRRAVGILGASGPTAGGADDERGGNGDADVVHTKVRVELGGRVELVCVPAGILEHAQFRKPLGDEIEVADVARPRERARDAGGPLDIELNGFVRLDGQPERHGHHRPVQRVPVVRGDEARRGGQVARRSGWLTKAHCADVDRAPAIRPRGGVGASHAALAQPRRLRVAPGVPIEMELQLGRRLRADVAPADRFAAAQGARRVIEPHVDVVAGIARRSRARLGRVVRLHAYST